MNEQQSSSSTTKNDDKKEEEAEELEGVSSKYVHGDRVYSLSSGGRHVATPQQEADDDITIEDDDESVGASRRHGSKPSAAKARIILHDGSIRGHKLTDKQRRYFGWIAGGGGGRRKVGQPNDDDSEDGDTTDTDDDDEDDGQDGSDSFVVIAGAPNSQKRVIRWMTKKRHKPTYY